MENGKWKTKMKSLFSIMRFPFSVILSVFQKASKFARIGRSMKSGA
jgi:hypothetical protein